MKRKILSVISCVIALIMCMSFTACGTQSEAKAESFVSLDINPSIELTLDKNDKVISVRGTNEDGQVLLVDVNLKGLNVEAAVERITDLAVELGYLDENNKVVGTSVSAKDGTDASAILSKINSKITATAEAAGITITTDGEGAWSLIRKFEAFKEAHPELAEEYLNDMTIAEFKLALSASETGEISLEAAVKLDDAALIDIVNKARKDIEAYANDAYLKAKAAAEAEYNEHIGPELDKIYENLDVDIITKYAILAKDAIYKKLNNAARDFNKFADQLMYLEDVGSCDITLQANGIVDELNNAGVSVTIDELKNNSGIVTLDSVYAYLDKYYKNHKDDAGIDVIMSNIESALALIETTAQGLADTAVNSINGLISAAAVLIPDEYIPEGVDLTDGIDQAEARIIADAMEEEANKLAAEIEALLDKDVLKEIKNKKAQIENQFAEHKTEMQNKINNHKQSVKDHLNGIKENLREQHQPHAA